MTEESKHLAMRQAYLHYRSEETNEIRFEYVPSRDNLPDIGTKLLGAQTFVPIRNAIYGNQIVNHTRGTDAKSRLEDRPRAEE